MGTHRRDEADTQERDDGEERVPGAGDDERENRKHIADTGEPERDALDNADGRADGRPR